MLNAIKFRYTRKAFLKIMFFVLLVTQICSAQWFRQISNTTSYLYGVCIIDLDNSRRSNRTVF